MRSQVMRMRSFSNKVEQVEQRMRISLLHMRIINHEKLS